LSFAIASNSNKDVALSLASRGLHVFPCNAEKEPIVPLGTSWILAATASPFAIATKWDAHPDALPAIPVGAHKLLVIDADRHEGCADGVVAFDALCKERKIDQTAFFVVATPNKGLHFYFRTDVPYGDSSGSLPDGIDVKCLGYVIAPGATLPDGRSYVLTYGSWDAIPPLPDALASFLRERSPVASPTLAAPADRSVVTGRDRAYAEAVLVKEIATLSAAKKGSRNKATFQSAANLAEFIPNGQLGIEEIREALFKGCEENGSAQDEEAKMNKSIVSGLKTGMANPRPLLPVDTDYSDVMPMIANGIAAYKASQSNKPAKEWPAELNADAYIGIAGDFIRLVAPHTEGDPCALLVAFLTVVGSIMGRGAHLPVGPTMHYPNLFSVIVAETSKGRKGTVMAEAKRFAKMIDPTISTRMLGGLSSGEGLIEAVRDARRDDSPAKESKSPIPQLVDNGVSDKRLLVTESEMGQALQAAGRDGNTLSATLRMAWDGDELRTLARSNKNVCREPHISIFGNITLDELQRLLTSTDRNNGFGNRFLWVCARRSQELPWGGNVEDAALQELAARASHVLTAATYYGRCGWVADAASLWAKEYGRLSSGRAGLSGAMSARAEAQTLRIALIYAALDGCNNIDVHHLRAALEVWRYCQDSVDYCFGSASGDTTADAILNMLTSKPEGASRTEINRYFDKNKSKEQLQRALDSLLASGKARSERRKTGGAPAQYWFAC
jgi:hypothetical protein